MATATPPPPVLISTTTIHSLITHESLIRHLRSTLPHLSAAVHSPLRHAHQTSPNSSLLLMPSWSSSPSLPYIGTKLVTHHPANSSLSMPGVHAVYVLFCSATGRPLATMDATDLTLYRTACVSALASSHLSREDSNTLVMVGAGQLAPHLIKAHLSVRPKIKRVVVWNRTIEKAQKLVIQLRNDDIALQGEVSFECCSGCLDEAVRTADIICCATNSKTPLVRGVDLRSGAHLDLVGSFTPSMRECDDAAIARGRVYVDNEGAVEEAGELVGAFERGVIGRDVIVGDLVGLIKGDVQGRRDLGEITVFKSVGSAVVDLLSAQLVYENLCGITRGGRAPPRSPHADRFLASHILRPETEEDEKPIENRGCEPPSRP
ncbi:NAD(P)-binding Rossmann-fold superfamily protein [Striga hermonthica]|uniref:NAD(P)-binding Rossmann-fold superfamily protein n=1 Tax=Striga hermonthica TaxID=68872 RepID=A0A9N7RCW4_STRHE|nr:NAD(P)-binding Rossmann-fold superfamily protein [Striga hermonthica]